MKMKPIGLMETKNGSKKLAETNSRWSFAALCNAENSIGLRGLHDRPRLAKVSMRKEEKLEREKTTDRTYSSADGANARA